MVRLPVAHLVTAVAVFALASAVVGETLRGDAVETIPAPAAASAWNPAPSFDTLTGIATDAQAFIADGVPRLEAIERATESHGLQFQQGLDPLSQWFTDQQLEDCEFVYWFLTDSFVNPCDPWAGFVGAPPPLAMFFGTIWLPGMGITDFLGTPLYPGAHFNGGGDRPFSHSPTAIGTWSADFASSLTGPFRLTGTFWTTIGGVTIASPIAVPHGGNPIGIPAFNHYHVSSATDLAPGVEPTEIWYTDHRVDNGDFAVTGIFEAGGGVLGVEAAVIT